MADLGVQRGFRDDDASAFDVIVDEADVEAGVVVDVVETVGKVCGDLHSRDPSGEDREARVLLVAEDLGERPAAGEFVDEVDVFARDGRAEETDDSRVVAPADDGEPFLEFMHVVFSPELPLEDDRFLPAQSAAPAGRGGRRRVPLGEEIVGGGSNLGDVVDVGILRK